MIAMKSVNISATWIYWLFSWWNMEKAIVTHFHSVILVSINMRTNRYCVTIVLMLLVLPCHWNIGVLLQNAESTGFFSESLLL